MLPDAYSQSVFLQGRTKLVSDGRWGKRQRQESQFLRQTGEVLSFIKRRIVQPDRPADKRQSWMSL